MDPNPNHILIQSAVRALNAGRFAEARALCEQVLACEANHPEALRVLGLILFHSGEDREQAPDMLCRSIAANPASAEAHFNLGTVLDALGYFDEAIESFKRTLLIYPHSAEAVCNIGCVHQGKCEVNEAIVMLRRAIAMNPSLAEAHDNLAQALLASGQFREGWQEREYRLKLPPAVTTPLPFNVPRWDGSDLRGRTVLVHAEQGFGDTIQFVRYIPDVIGRGGRVLLVIRRELERLLQGENSQGATVVSRLVMGTHPFQAHVQLMSLPAVLGLDAPSPLSAPYLRVDAASQARFADVFAGASGLKVGLVWAGNPVHKADRQRSIPLSALAGLAQSRATFYSLQVGPAASELPRAPFPLIDATARLSDFADTAALIAGVDLVIAVDTAVAHLAGAMGKPTWLLLPYAPDWRWLTGRDDSPWYPSMRLFRQTIYGDWDGPLVRVADRLAGLLATR